VVVGIVVVVVIVVEVIVVVVEAADVEVVEAPVVTSRTGVVVGEDSPSPEQATSNATTASSKTERFTPASTSSLSNDRRPA
jgi:hypothetical protein